MTARPFLAFASLILIAGAIVLLLLTFLGGALSPNPLNLIWFLEVDTSKIQGAQPVSRWTLWSICGSDSAGLNANCGSPSPAFPFDPANNFNTQNNIPADFIGSNKYYYMTRIMFAFLLIALFFGVCALFLSVFALCSRIGSYLSSTAALIAFIFQTVAAALMTASFVMGRNAFIANGQNADLGRYAFGFVWGAMAAFMLAVILLCVGGSISRDGSPSFRRSRSKRSRRSYLNGDASSFTRS